MTRPCDRSMFALLLCAFTLYSGLFVWRTSLVVDGTRYFSLQDDAMVSMRYARNLANGDGLVWNPGGDRVQGFTNPLWVGVMALVHTWPLPTATTSLAVQLLALACALVTLWIVRRLALRVGDGKRGWSAAVLMTATYLPLNNWTLQGTEVALLAPLVAASALVSVERLTGRREWSALPYWLLATAVLVRLDMALPFVCLLAFMLVMDHERRRAHAAIGGTLLVAAVAAQIGFSWWYFGDPLPNTYYLKMSGYPALLRVARGAAVTLKFLGMMVLGVALVLLALWREPGRGRLLLAALVTGQLTYSVYVGGDAWEWWGGSNRYVSVAMPLFFVLAGAGFQHLLALSGRAGQPAAGMRRRLVAAAVLAALIVGFNQTRGRTALREWVLLDRPMEVETNEQLVRLAVDLRDHTAPDARIAVTWAGALPYFADRPAIDLLGKTDPVIARQPARRRPGESPFAEFHPGHLKWDYGRSIGELRPDVVAQLWRDPETARPFLSRGYERRRIGSAVVFVRKRPDPGQHGSD